MVRSGVTRMGFLSLWSKNTAAEFLSEASVVIPSINEMIKKTQEFEEGKLPWIDIVVPGWKFGFCLRDGW